MCYACHGLSCLHATRTMVGTLSGMAEETAGYPLDLVKVRDAFMYVCIDQLTDLLIIQTRMQAHDHHPTGAFGIRTDFAFFLNGLASYPTKFT